MNRHAWRFYGPALVLATAPAVTAANMYVASTPLLLQELLRDLGITLLVATIVAIIVALSPGRHSEKGAAFTLLVVAAGVYPALADAAGVGPCTWGDTALGTAFLGALVVALVGANRLAPGLLEGLHGLAWLGAVALLLYAGYSVGVRAIRAYRAPDRSALGGLPVILDRSRPAPDIIHIIFDGMGRLDELHDDYGIDTVAARRSLDAEGLRISTNAVANYAQTYLAVSAMLSMDYLDQARQLATGDSDRTLPEAIITQSTVLRALKARGYRFTLLSSGYAALAEHPLADDGIMGPTLVSEFEGYLLWRTIFRTLPVRAFTFVPHRDRTRALLAALQDFAPRREPRFVLAHVMLPHPPFVFDAEGRDVTPPGLFTWADGSQFRGTAAEFKAGYSAQARLTLATLRDLLGRWNRLSRPPIVIVHGDHGSGLGYDMYTPVGSNTSGRMKIFLGIKGLDDASTLPKSPVNIYREVFNQRFGTLLPVLPDRSVVSSWPKPYDWTEVHVGAPSLGPSPLHGVQ